MSRDGGGRRGAIGRIAWLSAAAIGGLAAWLAWSGRLASFAAPPEPPPVSAAPQQDGGIAALGRLEPKDGVRRIAGPAQMVAVVGELLVDKRDLVRRGQVIARLDESALREAELARAAAELRNAEAELTRHLELHKGNVISDSKRDELQLALDVARADVRRAEAELERNRVRSPIDGQVIAVHARDGERVNGEGIVELGRTQEMYAIAEVYETDIGRVRLGQTAKVTSPALPRPLRGAVDRIGMKVGKMDALGTDPAARTDARVVEVEIRLADGESELAAALTHLQVEIEIEP
jgi:HlyD family secretion protein